MGLAVEGCSRAVQSWNMLPCHWICSHSCFVIPSMVTTPAVWPLAGGNGGSPTAVPLQLPQNQYQRVHLVSIMQCSCRGEALKTWTSLFCFAVKINVDLSEMHLDWKSQPLTLCGKGVGLWLYTRQVPASRTEVHPNKLSNTNMLLVNILHSLTVSVIYVLCLRVFWGKRRF